MKFNPKEKDLIPTAKTEITLNDLELECEELSDEEATSINGGGVFVPSGTSRFSLSEFYKLAGSWGG
ncbi:hypothetical protein CAL7716_092780 [Calothrix sp. PCC 7716]|nr:hypothetical protein CAL7716_092780 [Calothrix sp. PCC 7716]